MSLGLATVIRRASSYPWAFDSWTAQQCNGVSDLPVGIRVLQLPAREDDIGWKAVIVLCPEQGQARLTWVHPQCVRLLEPNELGGVIVVGHTRNRGQKQASHDIGPSNPGVRWMGENLILDARWVEWEGGEMETNSCSGYCTRLACATARNPVQFGRVLQFAFLCREGLVCCSHGKHRSVSAAMLLKLCFRRKVDFSRASRDRTSTCCNSAISSNLTKLCSALRELPVWRSPQQSLSIRLALPCTSAIYQRTLRAFAAKL